MQSIYTSIYVHNTQAYSKLNKEFTSSLNETASCSTSNERTHFLGTKMSVINRRSLLAIELSQAEHDVNPP